MQEYFLSFLFLSSSVHQGQGKMWFTSETCTDFLRNTIHWSRATSMDTDTTGMNWKYPHGWFKPAGNLEEMGLATAMLLNCPSGITHLPSSLPHHHSFFTSDPPAYRMCIPWPMVPVLFLLINLQINILYHQKQGLQCLVSSSAWPTLTSGLQILTLQD